MLRIQRSVYASRRAREASRLSIPRLLFFFFFWEILGRAETASLIDKIDPHPILEDADAHGD